MHNNDDIGNLIAPVEYFSRHCNTFYRVYKTRDTYERIIHRALDASNNYGRLPVFSLDLPPRITCTHGIKSKDCAKCKNLKQGAKCFITSSYESFWDHYRVCKPDDRCYYEIILHEMACHLYIDIDLVWSLNSAVTPDIETSMRKEFLNECIECLLDLGAASSRERIRIVTLDSSKGDKLSVHFIVHIENKWTTVMFKNNYHCGAFVRRVRNRLMRKYGIDPETNPFFIWKLETDRKLRQKVKVRSFYADVQVYTKRRNWRPVYSTKRGAGRHLRLPSEKTGEFARSKRTFFDCLVQYNSSPQNVEIFECLEEDNSEPRSTNDTHYLRPDIPIEIRSVQQEDDASMILGDVPNYDMNDFYENHYPFELIFALFEHDQREFIFVDINGRYKRYQFFQDAKTFKQKVLETLPTTIHIGPVYKSERDEYGDRVVESREIVIDIDLNDYSEVRRCCGSEKTACSKCWKYAQFAILVLDKFFKDYGFRDVFFFFSGMKGIHCWVFDKSAARMCSLGRATLVKDLTLDIVKMGESETLGNVRKRRRYVRDVLNEHDEQYYRQIIEEQGLNEEFDKRCQQWGYESALLYLLWPRIDKDVTTQLKHPVKSPFCRHGKSGNLSRMLKNDASENPFTEDFALDDFHTNIEFFKKSLNKQK